MDKTTMVDCRGLPCPEPVLRTRKVLVTVETGTVEVLVDSGSARDNVTRMAERAGWHVMVQEQGGDVTKLLLTK